jgi:hypothetical protein
MITVLPNDETDGCAFNAVIYPGDPGTVDPVPLTDSAQDGCWDLHVPVAFDDFCGVGGVQFVTMAVNDNNDDLLWTWEFLLWMRMGDQLVATSLGTVDLPMNMVPEVSSTDINGDGLADLAVFVPDDELGKTGELQFLLSDGLGGTLGEGATAVPNTSDIVPGFPGAGPGIGGGQYGCGDGLQCAFGSGTKKATTTTSTKPQLL